MIRRFGIAALAAAGATVAVAIIIHTPPVRALVLRYALRTVQANYGLRVDASRLDYNLPALRLGLADVRISAADGPPFFEAARIDVRVASSTLTGRVALDEVAATGALVRIIRDRDGRTNLPASSGSSGEPAPLPVANLSLPDLRVELRDEPGDVAFTVPSVAIAFSARSGRIALDAPAQVRVGATSTQLTRLSGDATFDGRDLTLRNLQAIASEGTVRVDGTLALIRRDPSVDLSVRSSIDVQQASRWGLPPAQAPRGIVAATGRVSGPLARPSATLDLSSDGLQWSTMAVSNVRGSLSVDPDTLVIDRFSLTIGGGEVSGRGSLALPANGSADAELTWSGIDAATLTRQLGRSDLVPAGTLSGSARARRPGLAVQPRQSARQPDAGPLAGIDADIRVHVSDAPNARHMIALPGDAHLVLTNGTWRLDARHRVANVAPIAVVLRGDIAAEPARSRLSGNVQLAATDVPALAGMLRSIGLAAVPPGLVTAGAIRGRADIAGSIGTPRASFAAESVDAVTTAQASGRVSASGTYDGGRGDYRIEATLDDWMVAPQASVPLAASIGGQVLASGRGGRLSAEAHLTAADAMWDTIRLGTIAADAALHDNVAHVTARADDFSLRAVGDVNVTSPYQATVTAAVSDLDLAAALRDVPTAEPITGRVDAQVRASGPLEQWSRARADLTISRLDAVAGDLAVRLQDAARASYADRRITVDRLEAMAGDTHLSVSGSLPVSMSPPATGPDDAAAASGVVAMITGDLGEALRAVTAARLAEVPLAGAGGPLVVLGRVTGSLEAPTYAADLELGPATIKIRDDLPAATGVQIRAHLENDVIELRQAAAAYEDAMVSADGQAPLSLFTKPTATNRTPASAASVHARVTDITPVTLAGLVDPSSLEDVSARIDADLNLATTSLDPADVRGEIRLDRFDVALAELPITQRQPTRVRIENGFARIESWDWAGEGTSLTLRGQVNLADRQAAILADGDLDLRLLTPFVHDLGISTAGHLAPRLSITGQIDAPRVDGDFALSGGEVRIADPRVVLADLDGRVVLTGSGTSGGVHETTASLLSLTGTANGGPLTASGSIRYRPDARVDTSLTAMVDGMAMEFPQGLRTELSADLALALATGVGQQTPGGTVSGTVTILHGAYRDPLPVVAGLLAAARTRQATTTGGPSPPLDALSLDLRVVTDDDLVIDNNVARIEMGGDLKVIGTAAAPALSGRVEVREGGQLYLGRNVYTVDSGTIDFANPVAIEPDLNISATTRVAGNDIQVRIVGTPDTLAPELSSSTSDLGQADLASLLLTGRTLDDLPTDQAAAIGAQVLGNLSGDVLGFASRAVGLDVLRLGGIDTAGARRDPTTLATEVDPTARLTFGKSLGRNLDVTFSQSLRDSDAQTWIVDYLPVRQVALRLVSDDQDLRSYEFKHDVSFGAARVGAQRPTAARRRAEAPRVTSVMLQGDLAFPEAQVRKRLSLTEGDRFDYIQWQRDRDRLQDFYIEQRHFAARVNASRRSDSTMTALVYDVMAGPETAIVVNGATLDRAVVDRLEAAWATAVFDGFLVDEARDIVRNALIAAGYGQPEVRPALQMVGAVRTLTIDVEPGDKGGPPQPPPPASPLPVLGSVTFVRAASLPAVDVQAAAALMPGTPVDATVLDEARQRVQALYRREGFSAARVTLGQTRRRTEPVVDVTLDVDEGARQTVGEIAVTGNRGIATGVITRALQLEPGQPLRTQDWLDARRRVFDTGLFRRVDLATEPVAAGLSPAAGGERRAASGEEPGQPPSAAGAVATQAVRVRVTVEEWPALRLRYGFQAVEERPADSFSGRNVVPGFTADATRRTLFRRAVNLGGAIDWQQRQRTGRGFINTSTFAGRAIASSLAFERSREEIAAATLVTSISRVSWEQRTRVAGNRLNLSYTYRFERNHTFDTAAVTNPDFPAFDITVNIARLTAAAAWDSRDDAGNTSRGALLSSTFEYAPAALGTDIRFVRYLGQAYYFRRWRQVVFGSAARAGIVRPLGDQELIPSLRFFAGGARSVRGVSDDQLGPRDVFGDPAGGDSLLVLNQEARFPIYRWLRGVGFVDAGNVGGGARSVGFRGLVGAIGGGIRLVTPVALLRVDYGRQVWPGPRPSSGQWFFGIGQAF
jgi:outer membrane protein assembly factor BamA/autotransporter translocation and assembly factor TamB